MSDVAYDALGRRDTTTMPPGVRDFDYQGATPRLAKDRFDAAGDPFWVERTYPAYDGLGNVLRQLGPGCAVCAVDDSRRCRL